jgi:hypothetical protein
MTASIKLAERSAPAWDDSMVARWSGNPLGTLWPEPHAASVSSAGTRGPLAAAQRPSVIVAAS